MITNAPFCVMCFVWVGFNNVFNLSGCQISECVLHFCVQVANNVLCVCYQFINIVFWVSFYCIVKS